MKHLLLFALLALGNLNSISPKHDFHVSVTLAEWKPRNGNLEIQVKLFSDDLAFVLEDEKLTENELESYFSEHFYFQVKGEKVVPKFIGTELEAELTYAYLEVKNFFPSEKIVVFNTIFMEQFSDQSNIVNLTINRELHSAFLTKTQQSQTLSYNTL